MASEDTLWSVRLPNGDVRTGTFQQLEEAFQAGHLDGNALVLASGGNEWVKLSSIRQTAAPPSAALRHEPGYVEDNRAWQVKLPNGAVRSGTRQQLDEAFQSGHIDARALVLPYGARDWVRVDSVLGHGPSAPPADPVSRPPPPADPVHQAATAQSLARQADGDGDRDVWQVKLTRRQIEDAFRSGHLDRAVLVLLAGADDWIPLGSVFQARESAPAMTTAVVSGPSAVGFTRPVEPAPARTEAAPDVWQVTLANGEVRSGTREQLVEALRAGHLDANALVLASGANEWVKLGSLVRWGTLPPPPVAASSQGVSAAPIPAPSHPSPEHNAATSSPGWQVRLGSGEVRTGTREQLEEALRGGHLGAASLVLAPGASQWITLSSMMEEDPAVPVLHPVQATKTGAWPGGEAVAPAAVTSETESAPESPWIAQKEPNEPGATSELGQELEQDAKTEPGGAGEPGEATDPLSEQRSARHNRAPPGKPVDAESTSEVALEERAPQNGQLDE